MPENHDSRSSHYARRKRRTRSADANAYSRDRYVRRPADRAQASGDRRHLASESQQDTASAYSRDNAAGRYSSMERHASSGGKSLLDRAREIGVNGQGALAGNGKRVAFIVIAALLILLCVSAVIWYIQVSTSMRPSADVSGSVTAPSPGQPYYVLLLGSDSRAEADDVARADSIMLVRVDESKKKVTMVSLPRDLRVQIAGHGYGKLNSALTYNGFAGAIDAVSELAGVKISYYATVYFSGFKQLVNDLGGVDVEVPEGTYYKGVTVPAGKSVHINGKQALVLARCRHGKPADQGAYAAGDYQRTKNQRNLMKAIVKSIMKQPFFAVPGQVLSVSKCVETNMSALDLARVAATMRGLDADEDMYSTTAPATSQYIGGVSYQILDENAWTVMMRRVEAGEDPAGS